MPRLWNETIAEHRDAVREALLDAAASLVGKHGPTGVSMAGIAERAGVGRATLYRYFADLEAVLTAWHERHVGHHLAGLAAARDAHQEPAMQLESILEAYARIVRGTARHAAVGIAAALHRGRHVAEAERQLRALIEEVLVRAAEVGAVRRDVPPAELADFVLASLGAARGVSDDGAARLVAMTLSGLRPAPAG